MNLKEAAHKRLGVMYMYLLVTVHVGIASAIVEDANDVTSSYYPEPTTGQSPALGCQSDDDVTSTRNSTIDRDNPGPKPCGPTVPTTGKSGPVVTRADYVGYVFVPLLLVVGIVGNVLTVRVMVSQDFRHMPVSYFLTALAISDTVVNLLFPFNKPFIIRTLGIDIRALSSGGCKLFFWAYRYSKITSSWTLVLISSERFVAVWLHTKAKMINTKKHAAIALAVMHAFFAVYIGYWCSWADQLINGMCVPNTKPPGMERQAGAFLVIGLSFYAFLPALLLCLLNTMIVYKLLKMRKQVHNHATGNKNAGHSEKSAGQSRANKMLISIAVLFVILVCPISAAHLVAFSQGFNVFAATDPGMVVFREITQVLEQLNNSVNFFVYIGFNKRFRDRLLILFGLESSVQATSGPETQHSSATIKPGKQTAQPDA